MSTFSMNWKNSEERIEVFSKFKNKKEKIEDVGRTLKERYEETGKESLSFKKLVIIAVITVFTLISIQALTASIQHKNNELMSQNEYLQAEIDSLNSQIIEETKVTKIERLATDKYGMVYPTSENFVTIHEETEISTNLASTIKGELYR